MKIQSKYTSLRLLCKWCTVTWCVTSCMTLSCREIRVTQRLNLACMSEGKLLCALLLRLSNYISQRPFDFSRYIYIYIYLKVELINKTYSSVTPSFSLTRSSDRFLSYWLVQPSDIPRSANASSTIPQRFHQNRSTEFQPSFFYHFVEP